MFSTAILMKPSATSSGDLAVADLGRQLGEGLAHGVGVERLVAARGRRSSGRNPG
jgi:hypothetical protein